MEIEKLHFHTLDELRKENNIKMRDFCNGICSERQYWRYIKGSNLCPPDKITKFLIKLNMTYNEFYYYFYVKTHNEQDKINRLYNSIIYNDFEKSQQIINNLDNIKLATFEMEQFYNLCKILFDVEFGDYSTSGKLEKYAKYINYPYITNKENIGFTELNILARIAIYESKLNIYTSVNYLYKIYKTRSFYVSSNNRFIIPALLVNLSKVFGNLNDLEKSYEIANQGIKYSIENSDSKALSSLYYLSALCEYKMGMREKFSSNLIKCLATAISNGNTGDLTYYKALIKKTFIVDDNNLMYLLEEYIKKEDS